MSNATPGIFRKTVTDVQLNGIIRMFTNDFSCIYGFPLVGRMDKSSVGVASIGVYGFVVTLKTP
jgi:hypothetical protein